MPAGLKVFGDQFQVQIDGTTPHITLLRKGIGSVGVNPYRPIYGQAEIILNAGEILALVPGGVPLTLMRRNGNVATLGCPTANAGAFEYFIFSKHQASGVNYGMRLFDENTGQLIYDTGRAMLNVLGTHQGVGQTGYQSSKVAVIPGQTYADWSRTEQPLGGNPNSPSGYVLLYEAGAGCVTTDGGTVNVQNLRIFDSAGPPNANPTPGWDARGSNNLDNTLTVVDVSDL
jgi:hypothetical protein